MRGRGREEHGGPTDNFVGDAQTGLPDGGGLIAGLRAALILAAFMALTLPLMPVQAALIAWGGSAQRWLPWWYHRQVCKLIGVRIGIEGEIVRDAPVLIVANHSSWLDVPLLSAIAPVSFIAKQEVAGWPFINWLAWLQRTIYIDRNRRADVARTTGELAHRLAVGDTVVLFAEATTSDGNRVLPFKTSLFAAVKPPPVARGLEEPDTSHVIVQTLSHGYTRLHGLPISRFDRPLLSWYGDMDMVPHAWQLLCAGPIDVRVRIGPPTPLKDFLDRKELAHATEATIRGEVSEILRSGAPARGDNG